MGGPPPSNPGLNFGQSESGLFSRDEIRHLMTIELARSHRYDYPLTVFLIEIDRLESLHDLYGVDSKTRIVRSVLSMVRSSTRASDLLGTQHDERLLIFFPHTTRAAAAVIARRLLTGCRGLEFRGDGRVLRATLSIGSAQRADESEFSAYLEHAEQALAAAVRAGGDRLVEFEALPRREPPAAVGHELPRERPRSATPLESAARPRPAPSAPVVPAAPMPHGPPPLPELAALGGSSLEEKVANLFRLLGPGSFSGDGLAQEVLDTIHLTLAEARGKAVTQADVAQEIAVLEQRVARLKQLLDASEQDLARMVREKSADPGIASIYRSVQGLDPMAHDFARKKELLTVIYKANVELLEELRGRRASQG